MVMNSSSVKERRRRGNRNSDGGGGKGYPKQSYQSQKNNNVATTTSSISNYLSYKPHSTLLVQFTEETQHGMIVVGIHLVEMIQSIQ